MIIWWRLRLKFSLVSSMQASLLFYHSSFICLSVHLSYIYHPSIIYQSTQLCTVRQHTSTYSSVCSLQHWVQTVVFFFLEKQTKLTTAWDARQSTPCEVKAAASGVAALNPAGCLSTHEQIYWKKWKLELKPCRGHARHRSAEGYRPEE